MLWLGLYFPELPLEIFAHTDTPDIPLAVIVHRKNGEQVLRCNRVARAAGVRPGLRLQSALALDASLQVQQRDPAREQETLRELAFWALQFSSRISFEPSLILLEIGASLRLFNGLEALLQRVIAEAPQLGFEFAWGVAPTPMAAGLLARELPTCRALDEPALRAVLEQIPLARLTRERAVRRLIEDIGLHSIGECLALPRPELARRSGPLLLQRFDRLLGHAPDPREAWQPPAHFEQGVELQAEIVHHTALVFPARRLLFALCGFLRGRGSATQRLEWSLQHREERPDTRFRQGLLKAERDPEHLMELFRERIERVRLEAPVIALRLRVDDCLPYAERSTDLFESTGGRDDSLLERLGSRLGPQQVRGLGMQADHRPEQSIALCPPGHGRSGAPPRGELPVWLLPEPHPLTASKGVPQHGGPLRLEGGHRRIESGWWDGQDIARDYYQAVNPQGERLWVYQERRSGRWFLHGLFD